MLLAFRACRLFTLPSRNLNPYVADGLTFSATSGRVWWSATHNANERIQYADQVQPESLLIGVVGAGTAGAAAALLLARAGHQVTIFERVAQPRAVGAGITLQPTGQAVLAQLGLLDEIERHATRVDGLLCQRPDGRAVVDLRYADVDPTLYGLGLHRGVLFEALIAAATTQPGIVVHLGVEIVAAPRISRDTLGKRFLRSKINEQYGPFDLVIAADGSMCGLHHEAAYVRSTPYPWGAMWFVADDTGGTLTADRRVLQIVDGAHTLFGLLPTGKKPGGSNDVVSVFWSERADRVAALRDAGLEAWRRRALALHPSAAPVLAQIEHLDQMLFTQYRDVSMPQWHADGLVFLGDAAHATSPQLGQGTNLALWDALMLADCISAQPTVAAAVASYTSARRRHLNYYQFATRALTPFFQSNSRLASWLRNVTFPMSRYVAPLRRRMVRTMCGLDRGIVRRPITLQELTQRRLTAPPPAAAR